MNYKKKELTEADRLEMQERLGRPPICDVCAGGVPVCVYASKHMSTGEEVECWRWSACVDCEHDVDTNKWERIRLRLVTMLSAWFDMQSYGDLVKVVDRTIAIFHANAIEVPRSFKVGVKTVRDTEWIYNALRFYTHDQAEAYADNLYSRWTAVTEYIIEESTDAPNATE